MISAIFFLALTAATSAQFSPTTQKTILKAHNDLRSSVAKGTYVAGDAKVPSGANILKMEWDSVIAISAQDYANTCPQNHSGHPDLGENLLWTWSIQYPTDLDQYGAIACKTWEKELQDHGWHSTFFDRNTSESGIGHALQMAWAKTGAVGCGVKNCGKDASMNNYYKLTVVCQYKAQPLVPDSDIYLPGETCSLCPSGTKCETASGLCGITRKPVRVSSTQDPADF